MTERLTVPKDTHPQSCSNHGLPQDPATSAEARGAEGKPQQVAEMPRASRGNRETPFNFLLRQTDVRKFKEPLNQATSRSYFYLLMLHDNLIMTF